MNRTTRMHQASLLLALLLPALVHAHGPEDHGAQAMEEAPSTAVPEPAGDDPTSEDLLDPRRSAWPAARILATLEQEVVATLQVVVPGEASGEPGSSGAEVARPLGVFLRIVREMMTLGGEPEHRTRLASCLRELWLLADAIDEALLGETGPDLRTSDSPARPWRRACLQLRALRRELRVDPDEVR